MHKGGNEIQYRIRNIDAFIFDAFVSESYRGKSFVGEMIKCLADKELADNIKMYLAVRTDNHSAIKAYT